MPHAVDRRTFLGAAVVSLLVGTAPALGQMARIPRIGILTPAEAQWRPVAFRRGLDERGYVEGESVVLEIRSAEGKLDRMPVHLKTAQALGVRMPASLLLRADLVIQ